MRPAARNDIIRDVVPNGIIPSGTTLNGKVNIGKTTYRYKTEEKREQ